ncbi:predicted protein, partial [Nematostella vectensis]
GGWCAKDGDTEPYLQIDFARETVLRVIATQGLEQPSGNWVTRYAVNYSCDGKTWREYKEENKRKVFDGNWDADTVTGQRFQRVFSARFVQFNPVTWNTPGSICMRVELYEC